MKLCFAYALLLTGLLSCQIDLLGPKSVPTEAYVHELQVNVINENQYGIPSVQVLLYESEAAAFANGTPLKIASTGSRTWGNGASGAVFNDLRTQKTYYFRIRMDGCPNADTNVYRTEESLKSDGANNQFEIKSKVMVPLELVNEDDASVGLKFCQAGNCYYNGLASFQPTVTVPAKQTVVVQVPLGPVDYHYVWSRGVTVSSTSLACNRLNRLRLGVF